MLQRVYSIPRVLALKDQICRDLDLVAFFASQLTPKTFEKVVAGLHRHLPKTDLALVRDSCLHLAGARFTEQVLEEEAWRLAGNVPKLRAGHAAVPWSRQVEDEYVPVQILSGKKDYNWDRKPGAHFAFQVLAGGCCPQILRKFWSRGFCGLLARRMGFGNSWTDTGFKDVLQLVNLRLYVRIVVAKSGKEPVFDGVWEKDDRIHPPSCIAWNESILTMRARRPGGFSCPLGYGASLLCHLCWAGQDRCPAAVRGTSLVSRVCPSCSQESLFDPEIKDQSRCVICLDRWLLQQASK